MSQAVTTPAAAPAAAKTRQAHTTEPLFVRILLILLAVGVIGMLLILMLALVFTQAFASGWSGYIAALKDPDAIASIKLTLLTAAVVVPANTLFGICAAWCITKFEFPGKNVLTTLIDLPFSVSPVISGLVYVLIFGRDGVLGPFLWGRPTPIDVAWLHLHFVWTHNYRIIFTPIGIILATTFVTFPFVARELIAVMQSQGTEEEQAALVLGANGWQVFTRITLPNIKWGLVNGIVICNARAMGEFGAVNVVAGTFNTMPLQVDQYYSDYNMVGTFALASVLALLALATLVVKKTVEWITARQEPDEE